MLRQLSNVVEKSKKFDKWMYSFLTATILLLGVNGSRLALDNKSSELTTNYIATTVAVGSLGVLLGKNAKDQAQANLK